MMEIPDLSNCINGRWEASSASEWLEVCDPATAETLARVPLSPAQEVDWAVAAARRAYLDWRCTPVTERVQPLFRFKQLLEEHFEEVAQTITRENGKTLAESRGEVRRGIENVEVACGMPSLLMGSVLENVAHGIDEWMIRQPVGVVAVITPFNFPAMIPLWFIPYALACGNAVILKPSERVPLTAAYLVKLAEQAGVPAGLLNLVHGGPAAVDALLEHPGIRAVSFVGSTAVARHVYRKSAEAGKRVQAQGGAKNCVLILPDADMDLATRIVAESAFGCAGQRCLAASLAITVGEAHGPFLESIREAALSRQVGSGLDPATEMGPVISRRSRDRIRSCVEEAAAEGGQVVVDGRDCRIPGFEQGYFLRPSVIDQVAPGSRLAATEVFGPVLGLLRAADVDEAIELVNRHRYGNMACLFTRSGAAARKFRSEIEAGNIGINIGVAAPMAFFPFSGWKESFFGDLHAQGRDAVEFFTEKKVVIERWPVRTTHSVR